MTQGRVFRIPWGRWSDLAPQQQVLDRRDDDGEDRKHRAHRSMTNLDKSFSFSHAARRALCRPRADEASDPS
jgi:hypothetical protein